mmetsp:Transcript_10528/g.33356  ORF Transcript_10528/g.33356 Transcript_10528/m.33356 type:complete len:364 (-) Transcript_10528:1280-2371(-)
MGKQAEPILVEYTGEFRALERAIEDQVRGGEWKEVGSKTNPKHFFTGPGITCGFNPETKKVSFSGPKSKSIYGQLCKDGVLVKTTTKKKKKKATQPTATPPQPRPASRPPITPFFIALLLIIALAIVSLYFLLVNENNVDDDDAVSLPLIGTLASAALLLILACVYGGLNRRRQSKPVRGPLYPDTPMPTTTTTTTMAPRVKSQRASMGTSPTEAGSRSRSGGSSLRSSSRSPLQSGAVERESGRSRSASKSHMKKRLVEGETRSRSGSKSRKKKVVVVEEANMTGDATFRRDLLADLAEETGTVDLELTKSGRVAHRDDQPAVASGKVTDIAFVDTIRGEVDADKYAADYSERTLARGSKQQ